MVKIKTEMGSDRYTGGRSMKKRRPENRTGRDFLKSEWGRTLKETLQECFYTPFPYIPHIVFLRYSRNLDL